MAIDKILNLVCVVWRIRRIEGEISLKSIWQHNLLHLSELQNLWKNFIWKDETDVEMFSSIFTLSSSFMSVYGVTK